MSAAAETTQTKSTKEILVRGSDYLKKFPNFKLVGREKDLQRLFGVLMRDKANNPLLVGPGGVGCSALALGLQASKDDPNTPIDIVSKRFYWLDVNGLLSSGNQTTINEQFEKIISTLSRSPDTVLVIDDTKDLIEGLKNHGCTNLVNALLRGIGDKKFQVILESRDDDVGSVLNAHTDMRELFTFMELGEPEPDALRQIVLNAAEKLQQKYGIKITPEAVDTAIEMTSKYRARDPGLSRAQPESSITLLDRSLTAYRQKAHSSPPALTSMKEKLSAIESALSGNAKSSELKDKSIEELQAMKIVAQNDVAGMEAGWEKKHNEIRRLYKEQRDGEEAIMELEDELTAQQEKEKEIQQKVTNDSGDMDEAERRKAIASFSSKMSSGGFESAAIKDIRGNIKKYQAVVNENKKSYDALMKEINDSLVLDRSAVLTEFSNLSKIPVNRLTQDEREKLLNLDKSLSDRVFGQEEAVTRLSKAVKVARTGLKDPNKPQASFFFLGPSGVGKTEIAKALAQTLLDDERAMVRIDMSEYQEKHTVAKLIGSPPGYEGFDPEGGILTKEMRRNPRRIILFDEIEKAHDDILNLLLQILDDARLTDAVGRTVSFQDSIVIMTSNIGTPHFLRSDIDFSEARDLALKDLESRYRPEILNRFNGKQNIVFFNRLELPNIERIAKRELDKLNARIAPQGLSISMDPESLKAMCRDKYIPVVGARGITGYVDAEIKPAISDTILRTPEAKGVMKAAYDSEQKTVVIAPPVVEPVNDNKIPVSPASAASRAFVPK